MWDALHCVSGTETFAVTWHADILHYPDNLVDLLTVEVSSPRTTGTLMNCMCGFFRIISVMLSNAVEQGTEILLLRVLHPVSYV